jgi:hypothetical protein
MSVCRLAVFVVFGRPYVIFSVVCRHYVILDVQTDQRVRI